MRSKAAHNRKKGFTLIEVIVVLVIIGIIAAIAVPSVVGYIRTARQEARIETARTVFMVSQNALTHLYSKGDSSDINYTDSLSSSDVKAIKPALSSGEINNNSSNIRYIRLNKSDSARENNGLYKLIYDYISDKSTLDETVMIEYNWKTGKVLSAFYSEVRNNIGYSSDSEYNTLTRDRKTLKENETGYWGVDSTGIDDSEYLDNVDANLVDYDSNYTDGAAVQGNNINSGHNYGLLTAEFKLPDNNHPESYNYDVEIDGQNGGKVTRSILNNTNDYNSLPTDLGKAITTGNGMYVDTNGSSKVLVLVLDAPLSGYSIKTANGGEFAGLGGSNLTAHLTVSIGSQSKSVTSNTQNAYYSTNNGTDPCAVSSIRHLYNIKYGSTDADYVQTKDIYCHDCSYSDDNKEVTYMAPLVCGDAEDAYNGNYNGGSYKIYDLTINPDRDPAFTTHTGLFAAAGADADLKNITLDYTDDYMSSYDSAADTNRQYYFITGSSAYTGGIAGANYGRIEGCSVVRGRISSTSAAANAGTGGIAGLNMVGTSRGSIDHCYNGADVKGSVDNKCYAGGICGLNYADITYCENGTAVNDDGTGKPYVIYGDDCDYNNAENNKSSVYGFSAGGITGKTLSMTTSTGGGTITDCINAASVHATNSSVNMNECYAGGICGHYNTSNSASAAKGSISECYNAGRVSAYAAAGTAGSNKKATAAISGGIAGAMTSSTNGSISSSYNTGAVYSSAENDLFERRAGGIIGWAGFGSASNCYSAGHVTAQTGGQGAVMCGGAFGAGNSSASFIVSNCYTLNSEINNSNQSSAAYGTNLNAPCKSAKYTLDEKTDIIGMRARNDNKFAYDYIQLGDNGMFHRTPYSYQ